MMGDLHSKSDRVPVSVSRWLRTAPYRSGAQEGDHVKGKHPMGGLIFCSDNDMGMGYDGLRFQMEYHVGDQTAVVVQKCGALGPAKFWSQSHAPASRPTSHEKLCQIHAMLRYAQ